MANPRTERRLVWIDFNRRGAPATGVHYGVVNVGKAGGCAHRKHQIKAPRQLAFVARDARGRQHLTEQHHRRAQHRAAARAAGRQAEFIERRGGGALGAAFSGMALRIGLRIRRWALPQPKRRMLMLAGGCGLAVDRICIVLRSILPPPPCSAGPATAVGTSSVMLTVTVLVAVLPSASVAV